jgi:hypothetical protein
MTEPEPTYDPHDPDLAKRYIDVVRMLAHANAKRFTQNRADRVRLLELADNYWHTLQEPDRVRVRDRLLAMSESERAELPGPHVFTFPETEGKLPR